MSIELNIFCRQISEYSGRSVDLLIVRFFDWLSCFGICWVTNRKTWWMLCYVAGLLDEFGGFDPKHLHFIVYFPFAFSCWLIDWFWQIVEWRITKCCISASLDSRAHQPGSFVNLSLWHCLAPWPNAVNTWPPFVCDPDVEDSYPIVGTSCPTFIGCRTTCAYGL